VLALQSEQDATSSFEVVLRGDGGPRLTFLASSRPEKLEWSSTLRRTSASATAAEHSPDSSRVTSEARREGSAHLKSQQGGGVIGGGRESEQVLDDFERRLAIMFVRHAPLCSLSRPLLSAQLYSSLQMIY